LRITAAKACASLPVSTSWPGMVESSVPTICSLARSPRTWLRPLEADVDGHRAEGDEDEAGNDSAVLDDRAHPDTPLYLDQDLGCSLKSLDANGPPGLGASRQSVPVVVRSRGCGNHGERVR